jgi:hypothetical protein
LVCEGVDRGRRRFVDYGAFGKTGGAATDDRTGALTRGGGRW